MKKNAFVKLLSMVLAAALLLPCASASAALCGKTQEVPWRFSVTPTKTDYAVGEEIVMRAKLTNASFSDMLDVELSMQFTQTDTYLVSGDVYYYTESLGVGRTLDKSFNLFENTDNRALGEKLGELLARLVKFFGWLFSNLSPFLRKTESERSRAFSDFPDGITGVLAPKVKEQAGTVTVTYDGQAIDCIFFVSYRKGAQMQPAAAVKQGERETSYTLGAALTPTAKEIAGLFFGAEMTETGFNGGFFFLNAAQNWAGVARMKDGTPTFLAVKYAAMEPGEAYDVKLQYGGGRLTVWLYNNPLDEKPYPLFDIPVNFTETAYGTCGAAEKVKITDAPPAYEGATYTNPLYPDSADPFVLYDDGVYYLYATNNGAGFNAATSTDLVHWTDIGQVAFKDDIVGEYYFWAPEVYRYNGRYYLFYSAESHLAVAVADSPAGPFVKTSDDFLMEREAIDGHVFFDDDGKIYLYLVHFGEGNHIRVYELNDDLLSVKEDSSVKLTVPEDWEGRVNEGPAVLKHNGTYYLTYSGDDYQSIYYDVGVMTSDNPTGPFTRYEGNPVLRADSFIHGTGHHCFAYSPDGTELFIVYHSHHTLTEVHPRALNIDRVKFVPQENGPDVLTVYGPTVTPQPIPNGVE